MSGPLQKLSAGRKGYPKWQERWFELFCNRLYYYKDQKQEHFNSVIPLDEIIEINIVAKAATGEEAQKFRNAHAERQKHHKSHRRKHTEESSSGDGSEEHHTLRERIFGTDQTTAEFRTEGLSNTEATSA